MAKTSRMVVVTGDDDIANTAFIFKIFKSMWGAGLQVSREYQLVLSPSPSLHRVFSGNVF